jgi:hypothetical protein
MKLYEIIYVDVHERTCYKNEKILKVMSTETSLAERVISRWVLIKE